MHRPLSNAPTVGQRKRIVVVDDDPEVANVVVRMLRNNGFDAWAVEASTQIQARVEKELPDLVIMDYDMPKLSGPDASVQLKSSAVTRHIPIVFLSGYVDEDHRTIGVYCGSAAYLAKPINEPALMKVLERLLGVSCEGTGILEARCVGNSPLL